MISQFALQDAGVGFQDSVVVESPLPGGVASFVRFFFHVPQWIQIGGLVAAAVLFIWVARFAWQRRDRIGEWLRSRSRNARMALAGGVIVLVAIVVGAGTVSWDYMQHDNGFCTGCHVMDDAFQAFTAGEHAELLCHDCHQQSIWASAHQLTMWIGERPDAIEKHAEIPDAICEDCHATDEPELWQHVVATAGHRSHYESADTTLVDVTCLTCHGPEVHEFAPIDETCSQAGCHEDSDVQLGGMAGQTSLHCSTCHEFTVEVAALATVDSAASSLTPNFERCTGCHEMQELLADFDPEREPHDARCGVCHDAHEQEVAADANQTCTGAGCHDDWEIEPFHVGVSHTEVGADCVLCHAPHESRVDASDCAGCHSRIVADPEAPAAVRRELQGIEPFDTTAALQSWVPEVETPGEREPIVALAQLASTGDPRSDIAMVLDQAVVADTFEHAEHEDLACLTCHTTQEGHGALTFATPRGCQICHHRAPQQLDCADCHEEAADLPASDATIEIHPVVDAPVKVRQGVFEHDTHAEVNCVDCHDLPVSLSAPPDVKACASCHVEHHAAEITCSGCHTMDEEGTEAHTPPAEAHEACAACHRPDYVNELFPDRTFCVSCHSESADHEPGDVCTSCHMMETPEAFQPRLATGVAAGS